MTCSLKEAFDPEGFRRQGHEVVDLLADCLRDTLRGEIDQVLPWIDPQTAYAEIQSLADASGSQLFREMWNRSIRLHHPHYMGHQISPPLPIAALAGLVADLLNNGMAVYEMGMAGTAMERFVVKLVAKQLGLGDAADGVLTSGGSLGNLTALLVARAAKGGDVWNQGSHERLSVLVSDQAHYCIDRAVRVMGWGKDGVIRVPTDERYRMRTDLLADHLRQATESGHHVIGVIGNACCTSTGAFDDLERIGEFCRAHDLWFHVDGSHGAAVAFAEQYRHLVRGIEAADSVVLDFHKMLMTPAPATAVVFREGTDGYRAFAQDAHYLWSEAESPEWFNSAKRSFECTKSMMSCQVFSIIATHGVGIFGANVTRLHALAAQFADYLESADDFDLAVRPQTNIVCFRYRGGLAESAQINRLNELIRERMKCEGRFYFVQTRLGGGLWLRTTIANPFTEQRHLEMLLEEIRATGKRLLATDSLRGDCAG